MTLHHHHQELARLHQDRVIIRPVSSRNHSSERSQHDPFSTNSVQAGSDVVDELLKPLQSYFSVFRTGVYDHGNHHGLLDGDMVNGHGGPPAHNTRSHDKRYKIKKNQQGAAAAAAATAAAAAAASAGSGDGRKRHEVVENGLGGGGMHHALHQHPAAAQQQQGIPPPPVTNGYPSAPNGPRLDAMETEISQLPPPNLNEPPPNMVPNPPYPPPVRPLLLLPSMTGPPPAVMMSPPGNQPPMYSTPQKGEEVAAAVRQEQLENDISNLTIRECEPSVQVGSSI